VNREVGWAVLTLVSAYEATGNETYQRYARRMIDAVMEEPLPEDLPVLSFGHTSLLLGCRAYLEAEAHSEASRPVWEWFKKIVDLSILRSRTAPKKTENLPIKLSYDHDLAERGDTARRKNRPGMLVGFAAPDCLAYAFERTGDVAYLKAGIRSLQAFLDGHPGYFNPATTSSFRHPLPQGKPFAVSYRHWINYFGALDRVGWLARFDYQPIVFDP